MGGGKFEMAGGGAAAPLSSNFINFLQTNPNASFSRKQSGFNQALQRTLSGQGLNDNLSMGFNKALKDMYGIINNSGPAVNYDSPMAKALQTILQQQDTQNVNNLRARFTQQGGMGAGTPAAVAEARYLSESNPRTVAALGNLSLQENQLRQQQMGTNLQSLAQILGNYTNQMGTQNQLGAGMVESLMRTNAGLSQLGIPQAQMVRQPGFMEQLGGFVSGIGSLAGSIPGIGNAINGVSSMFSPKIAPAPQMNPYVMNQRFY